MPLTQEPLLLDVDHTTVVTRLLQHCKNRWAVHYVRDSSRFDPEMDEYHLQLWDEFAKALSTGNDQALLEFLRDEARKMAQKHKRLIEIVEKSGQGTQHLLELVLTECESNPELNENPKALHELLRRFNRISTRLNVALVQGYNEHAETNFPRKLPRTRAEQRTETLELFNQLSTVIGPGQFSNNRYRANSFIFNGMEVRRNRFYFIREGTVQLQEFLSDGRAVVLAILGCGDVFAHNTAGSSAGYFRDFQAVALRDTEVVMVEEEALRHAVEKTPYVAIGVINSLSSQLADIQQVIEGLLSRDITARLTHILLQLADEFGTSAGEGTRIDFPLTHQQLADMLGSNRVTITRRLGDLQKQGLLEINKHSIILCNREKLEQIAY